MGIGLESANLLIDEIHKRDLRGSVLTLGRQQILFTLPQLLKRMGLAGPGPVDVDRIAFTPRQRSVLAEIEFQDIGLVGDDRIAVPLPDNFFFRFIGFDRVASVDYSDYDGAQFTFDLNNRGLGQAIGTYDVVWDAGTMEHIFHVPNFMANMHDALSDGGTIMHIVPTNGMVDHGFYQISPTFFQDYYGANRYADVHISLCRESGGFSLGRDYYPHMLNDLSSEALGGAAYTTRCTATKSAESTCDTIPQQRDFAGVWNAAKSKHRLRDNRADAT
jgi:hypothetical protein